MSVKRIKINHDQKVWIDRVHVSRVAGRKAARATSGTTARRWPSTAASAPIVQALGGWKTERMMKRYAAVTDQTLRAAAEPVSESEMVRASGDRQGNSTALPVTLRYDGRRASQ